MMSYQVYIKKQKAGRFRTKQEAERSARFVRQRYGLDCTIVLVKPQKRR